jgi:hypothetical protein
MSVIPKEQILRLNCPGFGEESYLTTGRARPLDSYSVIVVNPISILHLFDRDMDSTREIDSKLNEGLTSFSLRSDDLLQQLEGDLKTRIFELVNFLERGGLLVYFLCRPFMVQGPSVQMDNYYWLESLAPDTPSESNVRHMSAVSHGRIIEPSDHAERSEFASYFKQPGLEWSTIIRTDFLTEGYIVLATAGPRKCIAAHLIAGDNGGQILFLPAPYSPDFDRTLMDCIGNWHNQKKADGQVVNEMPPSVVSEVASSEPVLHAGPAPSMFAGLDDSPLQTPLPQVPHSRLNPRASNSNLPPVPKFSPTTSRPQPGVSLISEDEDPRKAKLTAEEILDAVSAQAEGSLESPPEAAPFNERSTSDIEAAFTARNPISPPASSEQSGGGDLLAELESMSADNAPPPAEADSSSGQEPPTFVKPNPSAFLKKSSEAPKASPPSRNLLREMESMTSEQSSETENGDEASSPPAEEAPDANSFFESLSSASAVRRPGMPLPPADLEEGAPEQEQPEELELQTEETEPAPEAEPEPLPPIEPLRQPSLADSFTHLPAQQPPPEPEAHEPEPTPAPVSEPPAVEPSAPASEPIITPPPSFAGSRPDYSERAPARAHGSDNNNTKVETPSSEAVPEPKDLMKKMEEMTKTVAAPDWCLAFSFPDLEELKAERDALAETIRQTQSKITAIDNKIGVLDNLKNALLGSEGEELKSACSRVFKRVGWVARQSDTDSHELLLVGQDKAESIARIVRSAGQSPRTEIASLAQSMATFWGETEIEPKGILVAATWVNQPISERREPDFTEAMTDFAQKKSICLVTTVQLLCIYRDLEMGKLTADEIRRKLLETNGRMLGFSLEPARTTA